MKQIFVDTSAWGALADKADKDHAGALQFRDEIVGKCKLVTSNYILDELYTFNPIRARQGLVCSDPEPLFQDQNKATKTPLRVLWAFAVQYFLCFSFDVRCWMFDVRRSSFPEPLIPCPKTYI